MLVTSCTQNWARHFSKSPRLMPQSLGHKEDPSFCDSPFRLWPPVFKVSLGNINIFPQGQPKQKVPIITQELLSAPATDSFDEGSLERRQAVSSASGLTLSLVPFPAPKEMILNWKAMAGELQVLVYQEVATSVPLCVTLWCINRRTACLAPNWRWRPLESQLLSLSSPFKSN